MADELKPCRFRKKPVEIEAWQWDGSIDWKKAPAWLAAVVPHWSPTGIGIPTLEGTLLQAVPGDWIVRGIKGEIYPVKPDIFAATYEPVSPSAPAVASEPTEATAERKGGE